MPIPPLALLLLGDNVYIDDPESVAMQRYTYYRRQSRPEWRQLTAQTATFSIWDDHDFSVNDSWGGPLIDLPDWKRNKSWADLHPKLGQSGLWRRGIAARVLVRVLDRRR